MVPVPDSDGDASEPEAMSFEAIVQRLERVVEELEAGDLSLDESLKIFEEGVLLSRAGSSKLDEAERRVEELLGNGGTQPHGSRSVE